MSEKEKQILETIATAVPKMSEFDKGYLLGMGEAMVKQKEKDKPEKKGEKNAADADTGNGDTD